MTDTIDTTNAVPTTEPTIRLAFRSLQPPGTIRTFTGRYVDPWALRPEDVDLEDIAHSLARLQRYGGHLGVDWSVAEHSMFVADLVPPRLELDALIHDAPEYVLGDVMAPSKQRPEMALYRDAEVRAYQTIAHHFGTFAEEPPLVKICDLLALAVEMRDLRGHVDIDVPEQLLAKYERTKLNIAKDHRTDTEKVVNQFIARVGDALARRRTAFPITPGESKP